MTMEGDKCLGNKHILGYAFWKKYKLVLVDVEFGIVHGLLTIFPHSEGIEALNTLNIFRLRVTGQVISPEVMSPETRVKSPEMLSHITQHFGRLD